MEDEAI
jgi:serine/threonine protein kinase